jgi:hypothetical protein
MKPASVRAQFARKSAMEDCSPSHARILCVCNAVVVYRVARGLELAEYLQ